MAKFVDKQNLPQYRYFNNMIGKDDMVKDIVSDYMEGPVGCQPHLCKMIP